jgi:predicted O-methyltransferase YrrM
MIHFYESIQGWFDFSSIYSNAVKTLDGPFVEVGSWLGRSACYMAVEIINSGKPIEFYCVDTWLGNEDIIATGHNVKDAYDKFLKNIEPVKDHVKVVKMPSVEAAALLPDKSLGFVFIDAAHDYNNVFADINAWLPKVRAGGVIAGHDYIYSPFGVKKAVDEVFGNAAKPQQTSWVVQL